MTIQELYIFACKQDLLDKDVYEVINKFKNSSQQNTVNNNPVLNISFTKANSTEWSYEDVLKLFSN